ncbi:unnamed protein product [Vicia faba]|uniref:Uncharacterized protein n=1 Tax=Vicia faba TaxID=3906 RepID=A0AAV0ZAY2_VICFA|nr:unnamed protein product [Vicia faba]
MLMPHIIFDFQGDSGELRRRFIRAWDRVHQSDPHELGPKTSLPMEPYLRWVRIRAQKLGMPYEAVRPVTLEVANEEGVLPTILHPYMPTDIGALKRSWMQLRNERDSYRERFNEQKQKIQKLTRQLENERILNDYVRTEKKRPWEH